ncbi:glycosyltransferase [Serinibacter arcticus]|uniref:Glycosyltransferase n=1 Tax=Serinibacter arcticus TaxID=1655435 RepID=A0A2U1ZZI2_9MICO|nr:glycosyltransferase [Serinibacter arcticus]
MGSADPESGRILVLTIGALAVAASLIAAIATASAVYLDRKALLSLADSTAAYAASQIDERSYYGGDDLAVTDESVSASAADFLVQAPPSLTDAPGLQLADPTGTPDGGVTAEVTLTALSRPSFLPWVLAPWSEGIPMTVTASARAS